MSRLGEVAGAVDHPAVGRDRQRSPVAEDERGPVGGADHVIEVAGFDPVHARSYVCALGLRQVGAEEAGRLS
jgi:hypothetical protein